MRVSTQKVCYFVDTQTLLVHSSHRVLYILDAIYTKYQVIEMYLVLSIFG